MQHEAQLASQLLGVTSEAEFEEFVGDIRASARMA